MLLLPSISSLAVALPLMAASVVAMPHGTLNDTEPDWPNLCYCEYPEVGGMYPYTSDPDPELHPWAKPYGGPCLCGQWCQYICPPAHISTQWDDAVGKSAEEIRTHGGLYCDAHGALHKPRPDKAYCAFKGGVVWAKSETKCSVTMCQTVVPGDGAPMIRNYIPHERAVQLAIPDGDAYRPPGADVPADALYYVNAPGSSHLDACTLGSPLAREPWGLYAPYTVRVTENARDGLTYVTLAWNARYLGEGGWPAQWARPGFGMRVECWEKGAGDCDNVNCAIDPARHRHNEVGGRTAVVGLAGEHPGHMSCTTLVGATAHYELIFFSPEGDGYCPGK